MQSHRRDASARFRLVVWHVLIVSFLLSAFSGTLYVLLNRTYYARADSVLLAVDEAALSMMRQQLSESGLEELAARDAVSTLNFPDLTLSILDAQGNLLAENPVGSSDQLLPHGQPLPQKDGRTIFTMESSRPDHELRRVVLSRVTLMPSGKTYFLLVSRSLDPLLSELHSDRNMLYGLIAACIVITGLVSWWLVRITLLPVVAMSEQADRIGAQNLDERFPVALPKNEFSHLAQTFNNLLERIDQSFLLQRQFVADASHEMRTPLSVIRTAAAVSLEQEDPDRQELRDALLIIDEQSRRMTWMVEDMFRLARADAGGLALERSPFYLEDILEESTRSVAVIAATYKIQIVTKILCESPMFGDGRMLRQALINLLHNAVKYNTEHGSIWVSLQRDADTYQIQVEDSGIGIEEQHSEMIFDRFFRVGRTHSRGSADNSSGGAGLGLPIARTIVESHGGRLYLSRSSKSGSVFLIELPITNEP